MTEAVMDTETPLDETDRAALRAYLQRAETRLSTMHGIAGAFISGAGLLTLLPIFYRDFSGVFLNLLLDGLSFRKDCQGCYISYLAELWTIPFICSLWIQLCRYAATKPTQGRPQYVIAFTIDESDGTVTFRDIFEKDY